MPKIIAALRYTDAAPNSRGRKIVKEISGESILYDTVSDISQVIPQYILSERGGQKRLVCRLNETVRTVDYDVALFNKKGEIFKVLNVREEVGRVGYAHEVALPAETEYVSIYLNAADGFRRGVGAPSGKIPKVRLFLYIAAFAGSVFLAVYLIRISVAHIFGGLYAESYLFNHSIVVNAVCMCLAVILLDVLFALIFLKLKNRPKKRGKSRARY